MTAAEYKQVVASKYGSPSRFVKSEDEYFKEGITWVQTTNLGINARVLPDTGIFGVASPTLFPSDPKQQFCLLGVMNSVVFDALARCVATRKLGRDRDRFASNATTHKGTECFDRSARGRRPLSKGKLGPWQ